MCAGKTPVIPIFLAFTAALFLPLIPARAWTVLPREGHDYVPLQEVADFYAFNRVTASPQTVSLAQPGKLLRAQPGLREVSINNLRFYLGRPLLWENGQPLISRLDLAKTLHPVLRPDLIHAAPVRTIILDPGHGGTDQGTWSWYGTEKAYALDVAIRVQRLLEAKNLRVVLTRQRDTFVPLVQRVALANPHAPALFVSIHFNAGNGRGLETYCLAPQGVASSDGRPALTDFLSHPGNAYDSENIALATAVHGAILQNLRATDRGIRRARFLVLREIQMPGILVEGGYLNGGDAYVIATGAWRQKLADGIALGIQRYLQAVPDPRFNAGPELQASATLPKPPVPAQTGGVSPMPPVANVPAASNP